MFGDFIQNLPLQAKILGGLGVGLWLVSELKDGKPFHGLMTQPIDSLAQLAGIAIGVLILNCLATSSGLYCNEASWFLVFYVLYGVGKRVLGVEWAPTIGDLPYAGEFRRRIGGQ